jgi:alanine racemase
MGALTEAELELALGASADVVAWTESFVELAGARALDVGRAARVHAKVDTGMGRLGTRDPAEAVAILDRAAADERLEAAGLMTHFATADEPRSAYLAEQLSRFTPLVAKVKRSHPEIVVHAANSAAVLGAPKSHFDMARCGIAIYGMDPFQRDPGEQGLEPALSLESYVAAVKPFAAGESAGYGRAWAAPQETCIGVLPIGYGDGYRRGLSNAAEVLIRGRRHRLVGTISMDNVTVDLGPDTDVRVGERAVLIGKDGADRILAEDLARTLSTINYEVTCGLTGRVRRLHHEGARSEP